MGWLDGEVVLVTGAGSGLGRAIVERFLVEGASIGVLEINPAKAKELENDFGSSVTVTVGDATSLADNRRAVADTVAAFAKLDCFIGNAGLWDFSTSLEELPDDGISGAFDEIFGLNVKGYLLGAKASLEVLQASRGSMIFTVSNAGFWPGGGGPLYVSSKHAVMGLVKQLAYELAPVVRVNGVAPGGMGTDLRGPRSLGLQDTSFDKIGGVPVGEMMQKFSTLEVPVEPADYVGHYVLLASRENSKTVTGSVHNCDTGMGVRGRKQMQAARAAMASGAE